MNKITNISSFVPVFSKILIQLCLLYYGFDKYESKFIANLDSYWGAVSICISVIKTLSKHEKA